MNVDEAMAYASKDKCFWTGEVHTALETLSKEIERLRAELAACQNLLDETRTELSICRAFHAVAKKEWQLEVEKVNRLEAELAEAKAASVVPEESAIWLLAVAAKLEKNGEASGLDSMTKAANWLRDRMKDTTPPEA